jgi:hypothetical protein
VDIAHEVDAIDAPSRSATIAVAGRVTRRVTRRFVRPVEVPMAER